MTQQEKIIKIMEREPERWWFAKDFMQPGLGDYFVGYEATARLSELANKGLVETKRVGRFRAVRLKRNEPEEQQPKAVSWLND